MTDRPDYTRLDLLTYHGATVIHIHGVSGEVGFLLLLGVPAINLEFSIDIYYDGGDYNNINNDDSRK